MRRSQRAARTLAAETASSPLLEFWKTLAPAEKTPSALPSAQRPRSLANPVPFEKQPRLLSLGLPSTLNTAAQGGPPVGKTLTRATVACAFLRLKGRQPCISGFTLKNSCAYLRLSLPGTLNTAPQGGSPVGKTLARATVTRASLRPKTASLANPASR